MKQIKFIFVFAFFYVVPASMVWLMFSDTCSLREWLRNGGVIIVFGILAVVLSGLHYLEED